MQFSEQVIEVLNYLAEKLGMAIDWTSENVIPYVKEIMERYRMYSITSSVIWIIVGIIALFLFVFLFKKARKIWKKDSYDDDSDDWVIAMCIVGSGVFFIAGIIILAINIPSLLRWCFIPEVQFLEMAKGFLE